MNFESETWRRLKGDALEHAKKALQTSLILYYRKVSRKWLLFFKFYALEASIWKA